MSIENQNTRKEILLTYRQQRFCDEYLIDLNATQAAIRAGYSNRTANEQGSQLLAKLSVQKYIAEKKKARGKRTEINQDYVLERLVAIDQMDIKDIFKDNGSLLPLGEWPEVWRRSLSLLDVTEIFEGTGGERILVGLLKKIRWPDKLKNLELIGKHVTIGAFSDKKEISSSFTVQLTELDAKL